VKAGIARLLLVLASVTVVIIAAEVVLQITTQPPADAPFSGYKDFTWHEHKPYIHNQATANADIKIPQSKAWVRNTAPGLGPAHIVTDAHGFRYDGDLSDPKAPDEVRVFLLGGSVTLLGLNRDTTICGRLEEELKSLFTRASRVRCVSAGIMNGVSDQALIVLTRQVVDLEPDLVLSYDGFNDIALRTIADMRIGYPGFWFVFEDKLDRKEESNKLMRDALLALPFWRLMLSASELAKRIDPTLALDTQLEVTVAKQKRAERAMPSSEAVAAHLLGNWNKMHHFSNSFGAEFLAILQPIRPDQRNLDRFNEFYNHLNSRINELHQAGSAYYSFDRLFDDIPEIFYDEVHTQDTGHERIAASIAEIIQSRNILPSLR
jgi:lysophospholipase L1-like esterase